MGYFSDMADAVADYPTIAVTFTFESLRNIAPATSGAVNVGEVWGFKVRVSNSGALNMTNVTLHLVGQNGALVCATANGVFQGLITTSSMTVNHNSGQLTGEYFFKAPPGQSNGAILPLVNVHINTWDADLDNILINQSAHADPPSGTYSGIVYP